MMREAGSHLPLLRDEITHPSPHTLAFSLTILDSKRRQGERHTSPLLLF